MFAAAGDLHSTYLPSQLQLEDKTTYLNHPLSINRPIALVYQPGADPEGGDGSRLG